MKQIILFALTVSALSLQARADGEKCVAHYSLYNLSALGSNTTVIKNAITGKDIAEACKIAKIEEYSYQNAIGIQKKTLVGLECASGDQSVKIDLASCQAQ